MNKGAVVLFSGGIDSTTALYWARKRFEPLRGQLEAERTQARLGKA